jgi:cellulose synthase/poly-beta-1,6-N-acetylglucosamine synthase-like glycosyltransferase
MTRPFADERVDGAKGVYHTREKGWVPRFVQAEFEERYRTLARHAQIDFIDTYSAAYRSQTFLAAGGFDITYPVPSVEDQELSFRLARTGARLVFQPSAVVYHRHDLNIAEYARRKFGIGYWKAMLLRQMPEKAFKDTYTPQTLRIQIGFGVLLLASLVGALAWTPFLLISAASLVGFILSALPFFNLAVSFDPGLAWNLLPMLFIRAYSLGSGLAIGLIVSFLRPSQTGRQADHK